MTLFPAPSILRRPSGRLNLILFDPEELLLPLPLQDPRAVHLLTVLRRAPGEIFDVGLVDGPRGKASVVTQNGQGLSLTFIWEKEINPIDPVTLIIGLPRPQTARDVLRDVTTLGVAAIHFVQTERSDPAYAQSTLWSSGEWRRHLLAGAAQAFATHLPKITFGRSLGAVLGDISTGSTRLALDNYEGTAPLSQSSLPPNREIAVAIGPERGWSMKDRTELRSAQFSLWHLGPRVLRTEMACVAALAVFKAKRGFF